MEANNLRKSLKEYHTDKKVVSGRIFDYSIRILAFHAYKLAFHHLPPLMGPSLHSVLGHSLEEGGVASDQGRSRIGKGTIKIC